VEFEGLVFNVTGSCPNLEFFVNTFRVVTNDDTDFDRGSCSDLRALQVVRVKGRQQADTKVLAEEVVLPRR
jgi:hypothetical protein